MILTIFLVLLAVCACIGTVMAIFKYPIRSCLGLVLIILLIIFLGMGCCNAICAAQADNYRQELQETYNQLTLYQDMVSYCSNEYVRFDFYIRVQEYNERYERYNKLSENAWVDVWYKTDKISNLSTIDFVLNYE